MGKKKVTRKNVEEKRKRRSKVMSPPGTPDELAVAVLTTTPKELKEWEHRQTKNR